MYLHDKLDVSVLISAHWAPIQKHHIYLHTHFIPMLFGLFAFSFCTRAQLYLTLECGQNLVAKFK